MTSAPDVTPGFSIVVPTYNRPDRLAACLDAVARIDYPVDRFEVIVVDDGSDDAAAIEAVCAQPRAVRPHLIRQPRSGPAAARNAGAARAAQHYLAFTDDDCLPRPEWLRGFADALRESPDALCGGSTVNRLEENTYSRASQLLVSYVCDYYVKSGSPIFPSNNMALPRTGFLDIGGFDTRFPRAAGEDRELCDRWHAAGRPHVRVRTAVIEHSHKLRLRTFLKQHMNYGRAAYVFHRLRAERDAGTVKVEPLRFYVRLIGAAFAQQPRVRPIRTSILLVLSQVTNAAGFFYERARLRKAPIADAKPGPVASAPRDPGSP